MIQPKHFQSIYLYNMLQDFRHLLIFDFRQTHQLYHIRDAFSCYENKKQNYKEGIIDIINLAEKKATEKQTKYKNLKRVRRFVFLDQYKLQVDDPRIKQICVIMKDQLLASKDDKIYVLNDDFGTFYEKYPFMCLDSKKIQLQKDPKQKQKLLYYPYAKFPAEIIANKLYLGNVYNSNSQMQLKDLKISTLFDFIEYHEEQKVPTFKSSQKYSYFHLPFNNDVSLELDFDQINEEIDKAIMQSNNQKVLLYCKDGQTISAAFAISYLMYKCGLDIQMATLKVCQAISRVEVTKWIYTQLLIYKPKNIKK